MGSYNFYIVRTTFYIWAFSLFFVDILTPARIREWLENFLAPFVQESESGNYHGKERRIRN